MHEVKLMFLAKIGMITPPKTRILSGSTNMASCKLSLGRVEGRK